MIRLKNVSKVYRSGQSEVKALDQVNLSIDEGEFLLVSGPSGSGKSTLLFTIAGMMRPTQGQVLVNETNLYQLTNRQRARFRAENVGFVFQMFHLVPYLSAFDNVLLPTTLLHSRPQRQATVQSLERLGMSERLDHKPAELSTGERQRTAIARALVNRPWLLLADEPTGNLDPENSSRIIDYLSEFHKQGGTVVLVTHDRWIGDHATNAISLRDGQITEGT